MVRRRQQNSSQKKPSTGFVRIISGLWRGRKLPVHDAEGLRPTTDRVKETVFNWLAQDVPGAKCLDLFAGSGGLGFESASRQAEHVTMIELNKTVYQQLGRNIESLKGSNIELLNTDAISFLSRPTGTTYDVIFLDPPFHKGLLDDCIEALETYDWLSPNAMIYIETEKALQLNTIPEHWHLHREKTAGQVCFRLFERNSE